MEPMAAAALDTLAPPVAHLQPAAASLRAALPRAGGGNDGQQPRISIVRLVLKNPPLIFLGEPTARLDARQKGRTVAMISRSLARIMDADCAYVLQWGRVVEHGFHRRIYARGGVYRTISGAFTRSISTAQVAQSAHPKR